MPSAMQQERPAWSWPVRLVHWTVAIAVLVNMFNDTGWTHRMIGYVCVALVALRIAYGFASRNASSRLWWPSASDIRDHLRFMMARKPEPREGHNPLGQFAVYAMWALVSLLGVTGWLSRTDAFWGEDWPVDWHALLSDALMFMVVLHLVAVIGMSWWLKQNLVTPMMTGKKK
jgi:cytochrome b